MTKTGIPSDFLRKRRQAEEYLAGSKAGEGIARLSARFSAQPTRHMLLISDGGAYTSEEQFAPLRRFRRQIASVTGIHFSFMSVAEAADLTRADLEGYHAVGLKLVFRTPAEEAGALARHIFGLAREVGARAVVFDGDDDQSVLWNEVIALSDAYIKKHHYSDLAMYGQRMIGKSNLTDYASRVYGVSFEDNIIPHSGELAESERHKILLGWSIALDDKIFYLAQDLPEDPPETRAFDILCRASVPEHFWTFGMRDAAVQAIDALADRFRVHAPTDRVPPSEYYGEMLRSRICVSPYGYGELCWRDFEAILCGCLLIKPDMSHVTTAPDLFVPGETYLPVAWDYSDLEEVVAPYLADESARRRIADTARQRLREALSEDWFIARFQKVMGQAGVL